MHTAGRDDAHAASSDARRTLLRQHALTILFLFRPARWQAGRIRLWARVYSPSACPAKPVMPVTTGITTVSGVTVGGLPQVVARFHHHQKIPLKINRLQPQPRAARGLAWVLPSSR
ncbi:hypothetical protein FQZ97_1242180 [compost metagenome]